MSNLDASLRYAHEHQADLLEQFKAILSIPSISTLPENAVDVKRTAEWLVNRLQALGFPRVEIRPGGVHSLIYAESVPVPGALTVLVYGHYDVQPVDPLNEWHSQPFEPDLRNDNVYARGASDMKGALVAFLYALESLLCQGPLPLNLKFLLEGEEEIGSPSLEKFIAKNAELLKADVVVNCDGEIHGAEMPSITYALRGLAYFELEVRGPRNDLHSGIFGGSIANPAQVLCELIAGMHDADGRVMLPGFYDKVRSLEAEERTALACIPLTDEAWLSMSGAPAVWGEKGYTTVERTGARPTLEVNGLVGGFLGEGAKTVLPAKALAKISTRLVADQDPAEVLSQLRAYVAAHAPKTVTWEVRELSHGAGSIMRRDSVPMQAAIAALRDTFGVEPFFKREGGSVPVVAMMQQLLGIDTIMLGFRLPDDNIHGPNEKQHLPTLFRGVDTYIRFLSRLAAQ